MIKLYVTKVEAVDESENRVFKLDMFDQHTAELTLNYIISNDMLPDLFESIKKGMDILKLDD